MQGKFLRHSILFILCIVCVIVGCETDDVFSRRIPPPQAHTLRITTADGGTIDLVLSHELDPKTVIALQTIVSNVLILKAEVIQQEGQQRQRHDTLLAVKYGLLTLCFLATLTAVSFVTVIWIKKQRFQP